MKKMFIVFLGLLTTQAYAKIGLANVDVSCEVKVGTDTKPYIQRSVNLENKEEVIRLGYVDLANGDSEIQDIYGLTIFTPKQKGDVLALDLSSKQYEEVGIIRTTFKTEKARDSEVLAADLKVFVTKPFEIVEVRCTIKESEKKSVK